MIKGFFSAVNDMAANIADKISSLDKFMNNEDLDEHKCEVIFKHNETVICKFKNQMLYSYDGKVIRVRALDVDFIKRWFSSITLTNWYIMNNILIYTKDKKEPYILKF